MTQLNLRDYQAKALDSLREGFAAGHRTQVLVAPTGAGKTEMAIALLEAARKKGTKSAMILDRIVLCDQTSHRLAKYGIDHGVMQAGHWRFRPYENIQVCSAQTLEKRKAAPDFQLMIVDECHTVRQHTLDFIKNNPQVKVIGLTATPFTKGLGSTYENVVSPITTKDLVDQGSLVPLRVFIAKEIDMTGAKKVAGEWSQKEASERGLKIVGDVVAEWIAKTHEIFGKPVKTIIFSSGVDHATSLAREFADKGYNFISVSYRDSDEYKKEVIEDFSKPDTEINGLIATDILTKGFDCADVLIGVSARPFSKSLSSHIQQMGRVMRPYPDKKFAVWLDHSGNYLRFQEDWDEVFHKGVSELDDGREKAKKERTEKEKKDSKCPKCGGLWPRGANVCFHCGFVREKQNLVTVSPGKMEELGASAGKDDKQAFWSQLQYKVQFQGWSEGRAAHTYKDKFGVWPRGLHSMVKPPTIETEKFIKSRLIAFLKGKK